MLTHTYKVPFEDFPIKGDWLAGFIVINATRYDWEAVSVEILAGHNLEVLIQAPDALAKSIRDYFMARSSWLEAADLEHRAYFPPMPKRSGLVPAWAE